MTDLIGLRLPEQLYKTVEKEAEETGNSMQAVIRQRLTERYRELTKQEAQNVNTGREMALAE